jgi:hypothetical protein
VKNRLQTTLLRAFCILILPALFRPGCTAVEEKTALDSLPFVQQPTSDCPPEQVSEIICNETTRSTCALENGCWVPRTTTCKEDPPIWVITPGQWWCRSGPGDKTAIASYPYYRLRNIGSCVTSTTNALCLCPPLPQQYDENEHCDSEADCQGRVPFDQVEFKCCPGITTCT